MTKDKKEPWADTYEALHLNDELKNHFGIDAQEFTQVKAVMKVSSEKGPLCLKRYNDPENKLLFIYSIIDHLIKNGFTKTAAFVLTEKGLPYFKTGNQLFYVTEWLDGRDTDFTKWEELAASTRTLAELHQCAKGFTPMPGSKPVNMLGKWPKAFAKRTKDLILFKKFAQHKKSKTEIDKHFTKYSDYYYQQAKKAMDILAHSDYDKLVEQAQRDKTFTHRDVAERNFIYTTGGEACVIDFDYARLEIRVDDLNRLIDRTLRHYHWDFQVAKNILNQYHEVNPLQPEEFKVLLAFLTFPQKFWRTGSRYYIHKGVRTEKELLSRLKKLEHQKEEKERFLRHFTDNYCPGI